MQPADLFRRDAGLHDGQEGIVRSFSLSDVTKVATLAGLPFPVEGADHKQYNFLYTFAHGRACETPFCLRHSAVQCQPDDRTDVEHCDNCSCDHERVPRFESDALPTG